MGGDLSHRRLEVEILDHLAETDPRAVASRRDLRRLNILMFQPGIMAGLLRRHLASPPRRMLEIGAGDGSFMLRVAGRLAGDWPGVHLTLLDRLDLVSPQTRAAYGRLGWTIDVVTADIFDWLRDRPGQDFDAVAANLFLHHFEDDVLSGLLASLSGRAPVFAATEPLRAAFPLLASNLLGVIGANDVTRNDGPASVRAGFRGRELSALWPRGADALLEDRRRGLFTQAFAVSTRR